MTSWKQKALAENQSISDAPIPAVGTSAAAGAGQTEALARTSDGQPSRPWWKRLGPVLTGAATAIGVVVGIVSIVPIIFSNSSSHETLLLSAKPYRSQEVTHYVLPLDAPIQTFPSGSGACSNDQAAWLAEHGRKFQRDYILEVRNTAESGPFISLQNFHGNGELSSMPEGIVVECDQGSSVAVAEPAHLQLDTEAGAYFDKSQFGAAGQGVPNTPLAYNLEPGETGQIVLSLSSLRDFRGELSVSAAVGKTMKDVKLTLPPGTSGIEFPGASTSRALLLKVVDGQLSCQPLAQKFAQGCQLESLFAPAK